MAWTIRRQDGYGLIKRSLITLACMEFDQNELRSMYPNTPQDQVCMEALQWCWDRNFSKAKVLSDSTGLRY